MVTLSDTMSGLETDLSIANAALERMTAAANSASSAMNNLGGSDGSHAGGLDYVPFDGYRAILHRGERIQTAAEADLSRRFGVQAPGLDYMALGGLMRDNVKAGGDVFLDGQTVGRVMSDIQGNQYRSMQRSGWQP